MTVIVGSGAVRDRLRRHRHLLMAAGAVGCAAIAVHAGSRYLEDRLEAERARLAPAPLAMERVVVARRDLAKGDPITADTMAVRSIPRIYALAAAVRQAQFETYQGSRLAVALRAGEPLLDSAVIGVDQAAFSQRLRQGVRALTIPVDEVNSISGLLQPGDRVDLFFTARPPAGRTSSHPSEATLPLLQNVLVLATGRQVRPVPDQQAGARTYGTITVELPPVAAQQVVVAQRTGRITAVLRHPDDRRIESPGRMDLRQLFGQSEPARIARRGPQMIVGGIGRPIAAPVATFPGAPIASSVAPVPGAPPASPGPMESTVPSVPTVPAVPADSAAPAVRGVPAAPPVPRGPIPGSERGPRPGTRADGADRAGLLSLARER
jgi:pilus assembly protein CpaB